mmetsp:Transcript_8021/g.20222  ORF Transcript_8021/g.20222 Transcript_8021/m.20222 type:complete len:200 (-) Transcript_8021:231-830(-)
MQGAIFHSACSLAVSLRGGECMTGTGGDGGPPGTRLCLNFGGSSGSRCVSTIRMIRDFAPLLCASLARDWAGVNRTYVGAFLLTCGPAAGLVAAILPFTAASSAARVRSVTDMTSSSSGRWGMSLRLPRTSLGRACTSCIVPCLAMESYATLPSLFTAIPSVDLAPGPPAFFPIPRGYCGWCTSGKAPPSPKSAASRGL